eukprot:3526295-Amphidinium_carterae.1
MHIMRPNRTHIHIFNYTLRAWGDCYKFESLGPRWGEATCSFQNDQQCRVSGKRRRIMSKTT